jgi:phytoene dehydrogenase-like protein
MESLQVTIVISMASANQSSPRDVIKRAYEFALRFVGQDRDAGEIWKDYIEYVKADPTATEREAQEKMDLLRSVYRRAVQIPLDNLEQIWREWDAFENGLNKVTVGIARSKHIVLSLLELVKYNRDRPKPWLDMTPSFVHNISCVLAWT